MQTTGFSIRLKNMASGDGPWKSRTGAASPVSFGPGHGAVRGKPLTPNGQGCRSKGPAPFPFPQFEEGKAMTNLEQAMENEYIQELKQTFRPWKNDPILTVTESLPAAKELKKVSKRLGDLKGQLERWAQGIDGSAERLEALKVKLLSKRDKLKSAHQASIQAAADAFLAGGDEFTDSELDRIRAALHVNIGLRGVKSAETTLGGTRAKIDECRQSFREVERDLAGFDEAERLTRDARRALLAINPLDDSAIEKVQFLQLVLRKFEHRRRSVKPEILAGRLDEIEAIVNEN